MPLSCCRLTDRAPLPFEFLPELSQNWDSLWSCLAFAGVRAPRAPSPAAQAGPTKAPPDTQKSLCEGCGRREMPG